jgi:low affinity Fe/Cu permease
MAARHQYGNDDHHVFNGVRLAKSRDGKALQAKLDELILTSQAQNKFVGIEKLNEEQLRGMSKTLAEKAECVEDVADDKAQEKHQSA